MPSVQETHLFAKRADALLTEEERADLFWELATNPEAGDVIKGSGGVRKLRWGAKGKGKSGGVRVIYYVLGEDHPTLALLIYGKNEQDTLSPAELKRVAELAAQTKRAARQRRR